MIVPMAIAAVINTFFPEALHFGSVIDAAFSNKGSMAVVGFILFFIGTQMRPEQIAPTFKRGGVLFLVKLLVPMAVSFAIIYYFGRSGFLGISTIALVTCITGCNSNLYLALMEYYGDDLDVLNFVLINIFGLPLIPVCILSLGDGFGIDYGIIFTIFIPIIVGAVLGYIDEDIRTFTKDGNTIMLPFMGFCLGAGINLSLAIQSVGAGLTLFFIYMVVNFIPLYLVDTKLLKQPGHAAAGICSVAVLGMTVPLLMAAKDPYYLTIMGTATAQLAFVIVLTAITSPLLVKFFAEREETDEKRTMNIKNGFRLYRRKANLFLESLISKIY